MSMTDPIADFLTRIRNAHLSKHDRLDVPRTGQAAVLLGDGMPVDPGRGAVDRVPGRVDGPHPQRLPVEVERRHVPPARLLGLGRA